MHHTPERLTRREQVGAVWPREPPGNPRAVCATGSCQLLPPCRPFWSDENLIVSNSGPATSPTLTAVELSTADWKCSFVGTKAPQQQAHPNRKLKT